MLRPRFSVVIPTRKGQATLPATVQSCLDQDFDDFEVIVCDNDGPPELKQAIDRVSTPRVRYIRTPRLLSMSDNWELAVSQAKGEFVTIVGNDDGLLRHALREIDRLIRETGAAVVRWDRVHYNWPCHLSPPDRNILFIPLARSYRTVKSSEVIQAVLRFDTQYTDLPMLYNSAIHRDILEAHRTQCCGRVILGSVPDIYSGIALGYLAENYLSVEVPMTINGSSGNSNGVSQLLQTHSAEANSEFSRLIRTSDRHWHSAVPPLKYLAEVNIADSFLHARQNLFPDDPDLILDRRLLARRCLEGIRARTADEWTSAVGLIRESLADSLPLQAWFDTILPSVSQLREPPSRVFSDFLGFAGEYLQVNATDFGVKNVCEAAQVVEHLLAYRRYGVAYNLISRQQLERQVTTLADQVRTLDERLKRSLGARTKRLLRSIPVLGPLARSVVERMFGRQAG